MQEVRVFYAGYLAHGNSKGEKANTRKIEE